MSKEDEIQMNFNALFLKFDKLVLTAEETARVTGISMESLKKDRIKEIGIPFVRRNGMENGKPMYSVSAISKFMVDNQINTTFN